MKTRRTIAHAARSLAGVACLVAFLTAPALAQHGRPDAPRRDGAGSPPMSAEAIAARLDRRLAEIKDEEAAIVRIKSQIDSGTPMPEVMAAMLNDPALSQAPRQSRAPGGPGAPGDSPTPDYTPERFDEMIRFLRETAPLIADRVEAETRDNPARAEQAYRRMAPRILPQMELRERDPEMFSLRAESMRLDWKIRQASHRVRRLDAGSPPQEESRRAHAALRELVAERVGLAERERALMIDRLERRVAEMRVELAEESSDRDARVDEKVRELLAEDERRPPLRRGGPPRE